MEDDWVKALGIDFGKVRIGLATSDDLGMLAHPLETISGKSDDEPIEVILKVVEQRGIRDIVIGLPLHADGSDSTMSCEVKTFAGLLKEKLEDGISIHLVDEWASTKAAREKLLAAGKKERDHQPVLDQLAAVEILQDWLNQRADLLSPEIDLLIDPE